MRARVRWLLIAVCLAATASFVAGRLLKHARAQLVPAYIAAGDDARAMLRPSLGRQLATLLA
ncbi:hypothetical protein EPN42_06105, partial [bacterium]